MDELRWREKLLRLDLQRDCSALTSEDSCWLCDNLSDWNDVLGALRLNLLEEKQGKICLNSPAGRASIFVNKRAALLNTAFFIAWLPRKHHCIEALDLSEGHPHLHVAALLDFIARSPTNLRHISIGGMERGDASFDWARLLNSLGATEHLESLFLYNLDVSDSLASKLNQLLLTNAGCLRSVTLCNTTISSSASDIFMSGISKCEELRELTVDADLDSSGLNNFARLLRRTETLQKLCMLEQAFDDGDPGTEVANRRNNEEVLTVICDLLSKNTTLTEFCYQGNGHFFTGILKALESNDLLRCLTISCNGFEPLYTGVIVGAELRSMLSKNRGLRSLIFENCLIDHDCAALISAGLQQNSTLECLDVSDNHTSYDAVHALCGALTKNNTCFLKIACFAASRNQRKTLSTLLILNRLYGRLKMTWASSDAPGLAIFMLGPSPRPSDIRLDTSRLCESAFWLLCRVLYKSGHVRSLTVHLCRPTRSQVSILRKLLEENTSISCVTLENHLRSLRYAMEAVKGLRGNESVTQLRIGCNEMDAVSGQQLAALFAENEALSTVSLACESELKQESVDAVSRGLLQNRFITGLTIQGALSPGCSVASLQAAVARNVTCLNRAVRFALGRNSGKLCAEAFELFETKASLIRGVMSASGGTETEARQAVLSARQFIRNNYLLINRIVGRSVECHAGVGTQIDRLNFECWLAIVSYLKVSDVIDEM